MYEAVHSCKRNVRPRLLLCSVTPDEAVGTRCMLNSDAVRCNRRPSHAFHTRDELAVLEHRGRSSDALHDRDVGCGGPKERDECGPDGSVWHMHIDG